MNEGDVAAEFEAQELARNLAKRKPEGPGATGRCLHCGEILPAGRRWCDAECRDDWEGGRSR